MDLDSPVALVWWHKSKEAPPDPALYRMIPIRRTSRLRYGPEPVEQEALDALRAAVGPRCALHFLTNAEAISEVRALVAEATAELLTERHTAMNS
jgi:hypothetical protein